MLAPCKCNEHIDINIVLADVSNNAKNNLRGGFSMGNNIEQIGIRTTLADKMRFEAVEGTTSHEKLQRLLDTYIGVKNAPTGQIIENSIELLDMLKINLSKIEELVTPSEENLEEQLRVENKELKKELELIKGKYHQLNKEYSNLILRLELKGIKI